MKKRSLFRMEMSHAAAETLHWWSNFSLLASLVVGVLATYGLVVSSAAKESAADERANKLELEAANANERAMQAALEAAKLKARLAWRELSPDVASRLASQLSQYKGAVTLQTMSGDAEALEYAYDFSNVFKSAGWDIGAEGRTFGQELVVGLHIPDNNSPFLKIVRDAFTASGIPFETGSVASTGTSIGAGMPNSVIVFVGSKPRPAL
jgi:hypothetical protein